MFDTLLIIASFLLASLLVCLITLRLSIDIKHLCLLFRSLPILTDFLKFQPLPPFIRHLRVPLLSLNEFGEKSQTTIILGKFVNKP